MSNAFTAMSSKRKKSNKMGKTYKDNYLKRKQEQLKFYKKYALISNNDKCINETKNEILFSPQHIGKHQK